MADFHTDNTEFLETIAYKDLYQVFHNAQDYRNNWTGHGGLSGDRKQEAFSFIRTRLTRLRELLKRYLYRSSFYTANLQQVLSGLFNNTIRNVLK